MNGPGSSPHARHQHRKLSFTALQICRSYKCAAAEPWRDADVAARLAPALAAASQYRTARHVTVVKLLLAAGADPRVNGSEVLVRACAAGSTAAIRLLLRAGADPRATRCRPLLAAAEVLRVCATAQLLSTGAYSYGDLAAVARELLVLYIALRGLVLPILVTLRPIEAGQQLIRDHGAEWWRQLSDSWEVLEAEGFTPQQALWGPGQLGPKAQQPGIGSGAPGSAAAAAHRAGDVLTPAAAVTTVAPGCWRWRNCCNGSGRRQHIAGSVRRRRCGACRPGIAAKLLCLRSQLSACCHQHRQHQPAYRNVQHL
ncbi:hypothetical protein PLESTM_000168100 [Pleodorina starrii]|nr:hypothetical protein PLESTM_000168100 [Pleodorina starrii]